jgi:type I restriction enzyme S subunit
MGITTENRTYTRDEAIAFRKTNEKFGGLSNMAAGFPLEVNGIHIRTAEALYQACRFPHMPDVQKIIINERSPMTAKMKSKPYRKESRPDWDVVRVPIMKWCLRVKLAQNWNSFGGLLLATGERSIVEDSRKDDYWGAKMIDDETLSGQNVLGRLLMELREKLKANPSRLRIVDPLPLSEFKLLGNEILVIFAGAPRSPARAEPQAKANGGPRFGEAPGRL